MQSFWMRSALVSGGLIVGFLLGSLTSALPSAVQAEVAGRAAQGPSDLNLPGRLTAKKGIGLPGFQIGPGGVLEWPDKVRLGDGGGESSALPPLGGLVRALPGGNLVLEPQGDYRRCAIDLLPTHGKPPDLDAIGEFTIHRVHPTATTQEMISYSALARKQDVYAVIVEAHGEGELKPLVFMTVKGGLRDPSQAFSAEAMRMTVDGTMVFGLQRQNGRLKAPVDSITIEQPQPTAKGVHDSNALAWVGKAHDGDSVHDARWKAQVRVDQPSGQSRLSIQNSLDGNADTARLEVTDRGDLELPAEGGGIVLRSPNGKRWRVGISDAGQMRVTAAE